MNQQALKITTGAMATAIFGAMMLLNRQTGAMFEDLLIFLYPLPLVSYAAMYGLKSGAPVLIAMSLISFLFGNLTSVFYAITQAAIGLIFGGCLYHRVDMTKTLFLVMALSALVNVLNTIVLGFLFGVNLDQEVAEMQTMMSEVFEQAGTAMPDALLSVSYLKQMIVISMTVFGLVQGFLVYEISLLILRRLRFHVQKPKSVYLYYPPKWSGCLAFAAFIGYGFLLAHPMANEWQQNLIMMVGIFGYLYLVCFGFIGILLVLKVRAGRFRVLGIVLAVLGLFTVPYMEMIFGFFYIVSSYHERLVCSMQSEPNTEGNGAVL
ncbi:MAG: YybS family protein [Clostridiales bacterium]|nr:YybS family protein [Clostridiales bacterium]